MESVVTLYQMQENHENQDIYIIVYITYDSYIKPKLLIDFKCLKCRIERGLGSSQLYMNT